MRTVAEPDLLVGPTVDVEVVGVVEDLFVAVARLPQQHQPVARLDGLPAHPVVRQRKTHEVLDR